LLQLDEELRKRMAEHIAGWPVKPLSVVVYGSVARGQAMINSDIAPNALAAVRQSAKMIEATESCF
jgi:predicted nucleotidyltransferase